jgi:hypothetical protein
VDEMTEEHWSGDDPLPTGPLSALRDSRAWAVAALVAAIAIIRRLRR